MVVFMKKTFFMMCSNNVILTKTLKLKAYVTTQIKKTLIDLKG